MKVTIYRTSDARVIDGQHHSYGIYNKSAAVFETGISQIREHKHLIGLNTHVDRTFTDHLMLSQSNNIIHVICHNLAFP